MIVRVLGEGQVQVPDDQLDELHRLDEALADAVSQTDEDAFNRERAALVNHLHAIARLLPAETLTPSDFILPGATSTLAEVKALLAEQGIIGR